MRKCYQFYKEREIKKLSLKNERRQETNYPLQEDYFFGKIKLTPFPKSLYISLRRSLKKLSN